MDKNHTAYIATDLRYLGKGTILSTEPDDTLIVHITGLGKGRVAADQCYSTKREALAATQIPINSGWAAAARLSQLIKQS